MFLSELPVIIILDTCYIGLLASSLTEIVSRMDLTDVSSLCNATNLPNFVLMVNTFRFAVISYRDDYLAPIWQDNSSDIQQTSLAVSSLEVLGEL